jgi:UDP-N-acetylmuramate--alanine ligase
MPRDIGPFHILGIGGIGMSAIAEVLVDLGYTVQGSDQKDSANVRRLRQKGIRVFVGHDPINLIGARYVVISSAVKDGNPELEGARQRKLPVITRAAMLAELMRLTSTVSVTGTHGKTTTTSMIAHLFKTGGLDPTVITGGIINDWGTNARVGKGEWMVVEADESDGTHVRLPTQIGVVTNIDPEHLDYYGTVERMEEAYRTFFEQIPFYGLAVAGIDHPVVRRMLRDMRVRENSRRVLTFGEADDADLRLRNLRLEGRATIFDAELSQRVAGGQRVLKDVKLAVPGHYNALNALAAMAVATEAGIADTTIVEGLAAFAGVKRRFQPTGTWNGVGIFDDYAHHPAELASVLKAARAGANGRVIAVFQPHRYTRVRDLFGEFSTAFSDADAVIVTPIYTAGEQPIDGITQEAIAEGIRRAGHRAVLPIASERELAPVISQYARPGDIVLCLGAGTITDWAHALPDWLNATRTVFPPVKAAKVAGAQRGAGT